MRFAFIGDRPGWAFDRTAQALLRYSQVDGHTWDSYYTEPRSFDIEALSYYDLVRVGGLPLFNSLIVNRLVPHMPRHYVPTIASFWDADCHLKESLKLRHFIGGVIINDLRFSDAAMQFDRPVIYCPDKADPEVFHYVFTDERDTTRVGWAGSELYWPGVKNVSLIEEACAETGCEFVRQDREKDGQKTPAEMCDWFNTLDVYVSLNIERSCTPVPVIEALCCNVPVITTQCGDIWHLIRLSSSGYVVQEPTAAGLIEALEDFKIVKPTVHPSLIKHLRWDTSGAGVAATTGMVALVNVLREHL